MPSEFKVEDDDDDNVLYTSPQLLEVKEGKKREQPSVRPKSHLPIGAPVPVSDDPEEWYGLEYTLELSSRERHPSDTQSFSAGEHSKSRESWAAIHRGTIHPFFEDEDYYQWKNWHRQLDKQYERRKHKKGFAFKARSKDLSCLFVDEMRTRDVLYWQKGVYGVVAREVKERLNYITAHYPDPYFPPKKHDLGWYLKRSRSVGCIRELKAIENGTKAEKRMAAGALERKET
ncbi:hypothetical protein BYT27DRAFT_7077083 [Phlegmacium glaucopus]|nr:hypothetical protein BYT27DRAFT_7077083 [Phlegmacium glaucopus]